MNHVSEAEVAAYTARRMDAAERDRIADHLAGCDACTKRLLDATGLADEAARLENALRAMPPPQEHLLDETLEGWANNTLLPAEKSRAIAHLADCKRCREDADQLQAFASDLRREIAHVALPGVGVSAAVTSPSQNARRTNPRAGLFALLSGTGCATLAAVVVWSGYVAPARQQVARLEQAAVERQTQTPTPTLPTPVVIATPRPADNTKELLARVEKADQKNEEARKKIAALNHDLRQAQNEGQITREQAQAKIKTLNQRLAELKAVPQPAPVLPSPLPTITLDPRNFVASRDENSGKLLFPVQTTVLTTRPVLCWHAFPGATSYLVSLQANGKTVARSSEPVASTIWQAQPPLTPGEVYTWTVTPQGGTSPSGGGETQTFTVADRPALLRAARTFLSTGAVREARNALESVRDTSTGGGDTQAAEAVRLLDDLDRQIKDAQAGRGRN